MGTKDKTMASQTYLIRSNEFEDDITVELLRKVYAPASEEGVSVERYVVRLTIGDKCFLSWEADCELDMMHKFTDTVLNLASNGTRMKIGQGEKPATGNCKTLVDTEHAWCLVSVNKDQTINCVLAYDSFNSAIEAEEQLKNRTAYLDSGVVYSVAKLGRGKE